ncbi:hypothetical protein BGX23_002321 [Mortierella sp. AD031]|nr:hypothetical protein BGX23_002321 [Mortierella sp. AD031]
MTDIDRFLSKGELSKLMHTSHRVRNACIPRFFRDVDLTGGRERKFMTTPNALRLLGMNTTHIRELSVQLPFVVFFYYIVNYHGAPCDSAPDEPNIPSPINRLTSLTVSMDSLDAYDYRGFYISPQNARINELIWMCDSSASTLTSLTVTDLHFKTSKDIRLFAKALSRWTQLRTLSLKVMNFSEQWPKLPSILFFCCPPLLEKLEIEHVIYATDGPKPVVRAKRLTDKDQAHLHQVYREEPLEHLTHLSIYEMHGLTDDEVLAIFDHCPNLQHLDLPKLFDRPANDLMPVGRSIGKRIPTLRSLGDPKDYMLEALTLAITIFGGGLPHQTLQEFKFYAYQDPFPDTWKLFHSHRESLTTIEVVKCTRMTSATIQGILSHCEVLETFKIDGPEQSRICLLHEDLTLSDWVCTRMKDLHLPIAIGSVMYTWGRIPHYKPNRLCLVNESEHDHLIKLSALSRQILIITQHTTLEGQGLRATGTVNETIAFRVNNNPWTTRTVDPPVNPANRSGTANRSNNSTGGTTSTGSNTVSNNTSNGGGPISPGHPYANSPSTNSASPSSGSRPSASSKKNKASRQKAKGNKARGGAAPSFGGISGGGDRDLLEAMLPGLDRSALEALERAFNIAGIGEDDDEDREVDSEEENENVVANNLFMNSKLRVDFMKAFEKGMGIEHKPKDGVDRSIRSLGTY